jgi:gliding motility-associated-like protein
VPVHQDGCIQVLVSGGVGPYIYSWNSSPFQNTPKARFLPGGEIILTVIDQTGLLVRDTFIIPTLGGNLFANAGADRLSSCDEDFPCTLVNPTVAMGDDIIYTWTATQGGAVCSSPNNPILLGRGPGLFILEVQDTTTGCFVTDTVRLLEPFLPPTGIDADAPAITCVDDMVQLTVQNDSDTLQYSWTHPDGTPLVVDDPDGTTIMASDSGYYILTTEVIVTGCISVDSILVDIDTIPPLAIAAPGTDTTFIGCEDMAMLEGFAGDSTSNLTVRWFDSNGTQVAADNDFNYETDIPGLYIFEVTNNVTGCVSSDTTIVSQNAEVPSLEIVLNTIPAFNCTGDPVPMSVEITNVGNPDLLTIAWIGDVDPVTAADVNTSALTPGNYEVIVENTANNCISTAEITIGLDTIAPVLSIDPIDPADQLNCNNDAVTITTTVSPADGAYEYSWFSTTLNDAITPDFGDPTQATVGIVTVGEVLVTVVDTITGCESIQQATIVTLDTSGTVFEVGFIPSLNCEVDTVSVLTSAELPAGTFTIDWLSQNGAPLPTIVDSVAVFTSDVLTSTGEYLVAVTNDINGCTTVDTVISTVNVFLDQPTAVLATVDETITCLNTSIILDASGSTVGDTLTPISYQWNIITGDADGSLTNDSLLVEQGGEYQFVVTNENSLCADSATAIVMEDTDEPLAVAENEAISLVCSDNQGVLSALGSSEGPEFTYTWLTLDPDSLDVLGVFGEGFMIPVATPGVYQLVVTNNENGCESTDNPAVEVIGDGEIPVIVFGTPAEPALGLYDLNCASPDSLLVTYFVANDTLFDLEDLMFDWINEDIEVVQTGQLFNALIPLDGITGTEAFTLTVVDQATGCENENEFVIQNVVEFPSAEIVPDTDLTIGCDENPVEIDGSASSQGDEFSYAWQNLDGEELATGITFSADTAGTYELVVTNNDNFCQDSIEVVVMLDTIGPSLVLDSIPSFTCDDNQLTISASNSGNPADFTITWVNQDGASISGIPSTLDATVTGPGLYRVELVSNSNLCDTIVIFEVPADTMPPTIMIDNPAMLACAGSTVDIMTTINSGTQSVTWEGPGNVNPPNALNVNVDQAGTYIVTVVADNGCENTASVEVMEDPDGNPTSVLEASDDLLGCGDTITLSYTGPSIGDEFIYQYITVSGDGEAVPAEDSLSAEVSMSGDYILIVTNELNGCSDTSEVFTIDMIELNGTMAEVDSAGCGDVALVSAILPPDATGVWSGPVGVVFENPTAENTLVSGLGIGENNLVFTISYEGCPDYAADTVSVLPELAPIALDDELILSPGQVMNTLNVVDNDELGGVSGFTITLNNSLLGDLGLDSSGNVTYTLLTNLLQPADDEFSYEICSENCPELCDQAFVTVTINRDSVEITTPNGFTPNGDGMNDELVFDQLLTNPEDFKDNELIVFNRWGDIVFEAQPYNNDWRGTNQEGEDLPDGTYYFILRLNVGDGEIIRGDVTIIR